MITIQLGKTGEKISILGQGTWGIKKRKKPEIYEGWKASIRRGIEIGITHIDTAELYGNGLSEKIVGSVIAEHERDDLFITSKLFPKHVGKSSMKKACYNSLKRLGIKNLDLYLVHWPSLVGGAKIKKHMEVMEELVNEGKTRFIGVSNYSLKQFKNAQTLLKKSELVTNQLWVNVDKQKHIHESLPYYKKQGVTLTAYSPLGHRGFTDLKGDLRKNLEKVAESHAATIQQIAIAWLINHDNVITIPKAFQVRHLEENAEAAGIKLSDDEIKMLYVTHK